MGIWSSVLSPSFFDSLSESAPFPSPSSDAVDDSFFFPAVELPPPDDDDDEDDNVDDVDEVIFPLSLSDIEDVSLLGTCCNRGWKVSSTKHTLLVVPFWILSCCGTGFCGREGGF